MKLIHRCSELSPRASSIAPRLIASFKGGAVASKYAARVECCLEERVEDHGQSVGEDVHWDIPIPRLILIVGLVERCRWISKPAFQKARLKGMITWQRVRYICYNVTVPPDVERCEVLKFLELRRQSHTPDFRGVARYIALLRDARALDTCFDVFCADVANGQVEGRAEDELHARHGP